jgi:hypothetical protein
MKTSLLALVKTVVIGAFLLGSVTSALAATTLSLYSRDQTYIVSSDQINSNDGNTPYDQTNFYGKGAMMISANVADPGENMAPRTMQALFNFITDGSSPTVGTSTSYVTNPLVSLNVKAAFDAIYGAGNWAITNVNLILPSNWYVQGVQPNNPDFNVVASGQFTMNVLGSDPDVTAQTWNIFQNFLASTTATSVGTQTWTADPVGTTDNTGSEPTQTYTLTDPGNVLIPRLISGQGGQTNRVTFFGVAADGQVGYVFNTKNRIPPRLDITADVIQ